MKYTDELLQEYRTQIYKAMRKEIVRQLEKQGPPFDKDIDSVIVEQEVVEDEGVIKARLSLIERMMENGLPGIRSDLRAEYLHEQSRKETLEIEDAYLRSL